MKLNCILLSFSFYSIQSNEKHFKNLIKIFSIVHVICCLFKVKFDIRKTRILLRKKKK